MHPTASLVIFCSCNSSHLATAQFLYIHSILQRLQGFGHERIVTVCQDCSVRKAEILPAFTSVLSFRLQPTKKEVIIVPGDDNH